MRRLLLACLLVFSCHPSAPVVSGPWFAHLGRGDATGLARVRAEFHHRNPGCDLAWNPELTELPPRRVERVMFVQSGSARAVLRRVDEGKVESDLAVGDLVLVAAGDKLRLAAPIGALVFTVPDTFPPELPSFVRPDWDEKITDTPGGCATETGAYRRILLTWHAKNGPYIYHALNAHRVRITDSFTHYHPRRGGFDEFYLVQMVQPGARLLTSRHVASIEQPASIDAARAADLMTSHELAVGDLVYMPRGLIHRGLGGVLAQVIAVPGFKPGAEIGVDHHLKRINERLELEGARALPFHAAGGDRAIVR